MMSFDLELLEREKLVGRLKLVELLEGQSHFRELQDRVDRRFAHALTKIPERFKTAALATFGCTLYFTKQFLDDAHRYIWSTFRAQYGTPPLADELLILELDRDTLRDDFYRAVRHEGRLQDNLPVRSINDIVDMLMRVGQARRDVEPLSDVPGFLRRRHWILLTDISLSGGSLHDELAKLQLIRQLMREPCSVSVFAQIASRRAVEKVEALGCQVFSAVTLPESCCLASDSFDLISSPFVREEMRELCTWFGSEYVARGSHRLTEQSRAPGQENFAVYGFGGEGWTIVTYKNCPNNSLPILWFRSIDGGYVPPFERLDSRVGSGWEGRKEWLERLSNDQPLRERVSTILNKDE